MEYAPTPLTKTTTILHRDGDTKTFRQPLEDEPERRGHVLELDPQVDEEMGHPDLITVTIEPGDLLNPIDAEWVQDP